MDVKEKSIGKIINFYRQQNSFKQDALAEMIGITQSHLSDIENDKTALTVPLLFKFASAFNVPASVLLPEEKTNVFTNHYKDNSQGTNILNQYGTADAERNLFLQLIAAKDEIIKAKSDLIENLITELSSLKSRRE
jgi:transcriptional regulator with XRE-family HTH domain